LQTSMEERHANVREEALFYLQMGFPIIPLCPFNHQKMPLSHREKCRAPGKSPILRDWAQRKTPSTEEVLKWFGDNEYINVGLILGDTDTWNLVGIDVDGEHGESILKDWSSGVLPVTWEFTTGNGRRLLYALPEGATSKKTSHKDKGKQGELALLATGQQTVLPPSIHPTGVLYTWVEGRSPKDIDLADAPQWLLNRVLVYDEDKDSAKSPPVELNDWQKVVETGERNNHLVRLAGSLIARRNIPKEQIVEFLMTWNAKYCKPPLPESEVVIMVENLHESEQIKATKRARAGGKGKRELLRPATFAEYFIKQQSTASVSWKFSVDKGLFYRCDDNIGPWEPVDVVYLQKEVRNALIDKDESWDTMHAINEVISALREFLANPVNDDLFDIGKHPDLIHIYVEDGLLDWRTGTLKPWDSSTYSTIKLPVHWDPQAVNSDAYAMWLKALEEWIPEEETRMFLQEYVGYCLVPDCSFRTAVFLYGEGSNGKSLFLDVVSQLFGKYISFIPLHRVAERFQSVYLLDRLINVCGDIDPKYLDETSVLKALIAGDPIRGEFKHGKSFDFSPVARLMFSANTLPRVADKSEGWYSRWKFVEFPRRFKTNPQYKRNLMSALSTPVALSALLCWGVEGLRRLYANGEFTMSASMKDAEVQYRSENDTVNAFAESMLKIVPHKGSDTLLVVPSVYAVYRKWCEDVGVRPVGQLEMTRRLSRLGVSKGVRIMKGMSANCFLGLKFSSDALEAGYQEEYGFQEAVRSTRRK